MIETIALAQREYLTSKSEAARKELGQYFTGDAVADYMASMIKPMKVPVIRILDAGAGTGILTISAALRCLALSHYRVHAVLYEIDTDILSHLVLNMKQLVQLFEERGGTFTFSICHKDFVLSRPDKTENPFHISSINPPYFKYNTKASLYTGVTEDLFKGNPNIYASFMAVVAACMAKNGQMIAIVPRSFTSGLYFKGFRQYMNQCMNLEKIHIFRARDKVFERLAVLQENVICYYTKRRKMSNIKVCTSTGYQDLGQAGIKQYPVKLLIDVSSDHEIIRIPETQEGGQILTIVESWPSSFQKNGYFISTGPVVEHRTRRYIVSPKRKVKSIPLLRMHNIKGLKTRWTGDDKKDASFQLLSGYEKHISANKPYVILKRFSAKDEKRRLVAGVHNPVVIRGKLIAFENHLNYIGRQNGQLDLIEAYGLAGLLNSTFMDKYFRCMSGNTQVNATEIRLLKLPARKTIRKLGDAFQNIDKIDQQCIDSIVDYYLKV